MAPSSNRNLHAVGNGWATENSGYNRDEFITRSTDGHGHQRHQRVNFPPSVIGQASAIIQGGKIPQYSTVQDLVRDAVVHRLHYLNETYLKDPKLARELTAAVRKSRMEAITREQQELHGLVEACREAIMTAVRGKDWTAFRDALDQAEEQGEEVRDPYRTMIHDIVNEYRDKHIEELR